jgi:ubiquinone/menaquinone biosynthesis C-methylase UbiE
MSIYGKVNSLDLESIDRPNGSYSWIILNHVLEHIEDDSLALRELIRVASDGVVCLTIPETVTDVVTRQWGRLTNNGHYRQYGSDFPSYARNLVPQANIIVVIGQDVVSRDYEHVFFLLRRRDLAEQLALELIKSGMPVVSCLSN